MDKAPSRLKPLSTTLALACSVLLLGATGAGAAIEPLQQYGTPGVDGPGGVQSTQGISVDPVSGQVVAADITLNRVSIFSPRGPFLRAFGKDVIPGGGDGPEVCTTDCKPGSSGEAGGDLDQPLEAEVSPDRLVYVSENHNDRVSVFTMRGGFRFAFGQDVDSGAAATGPEVCTDQCQGGTSGPAGGSLNQPWASSFGPDGDFYIASTNNRRIERFTPAGEPVAAYGQDVSASGPGGFESCSANDCQTGNADGGVGSLDRPEGIDFDSRGRIWVGSWNDRRTNVVTSSPSFRFAFGTGVVPGEPGFGICRTECYPGGIGHGPGEFGSVQGVAVAADGTAYVVDSGNSRVNAYKLNGSFRFAFGYDVIPGGSTGFETCTIATGCQAGVREGALDDPYPIHVDCRGTIYVASSYSGAITAFGEGRARPGPCKLKAGKAKLNRKRGTAKLKVRVPYAGKLILNGKGIKRARGSHQGLEGITKLAVRPGKKLRRKLRKRGKARVKVTVKMRPSDGNSAQKRSKRIKLKKK